MHDKEEPAGIAALGVPARATRRPPAFSTPHSLAGSCASAGSEPA